MFSQYNESRSVNRIDLSIYDINSFSYKIVDLSDEGYDFDIKYGVSLYKDNVYSQTVTFGDIGSLKKSLVDAERNNSPLLMKPSFSVNIVLPESVKEMSKLFNILSKIEDKYDDIFNYDCRQSDGEYNMIYIYKK